MIPVSLSAQLAGLHLILPATVSWGAKHDIEQAVMECGGIPVTRPRYPKRTVMVVTQSHLGRAPSALATTCLEAGSWVMIDTWLRDVLELGVRPFSGMSIRQGVRVAAGMLRLGRTIPFQDLELIHIPVNSKYYVDRQLDYMNRYDSRRPLGF